MVSFIRVWAKHQVRTWCWPRSYEYLRELYLSVDVKSNSTSALYEYEYCLLSMNMSMTAAYVRFRSYSCNAAVVTRYQKQSVCYSYSVRLRRTDTVRVCLRGTGAHTSFSPSNCESSAWNVCVWIASFSTPVSIRSAVFRFASESEKTSNFTPAPAFVGGRLPGKWTKSSGAWSGGPGDAEPVAWVRGAEDEDAESVAPLKNLRNFFTSMRTGLEKPLVSVYVVQCTSTWCTIYEYVQYWVQQWYSTFFCQVSFSVTLERVKVPTKYFWSFLYRCSVLFIMQKN